MGKPKRTKKKSPRATIATTEHKDGAHQLAGSEERLIVFRRRALVLKIRGYFLHEIADKLVEEFSLAATPSLSGVQKWIDAAIAETAQDTKSETERYTAVCERRTETIVQRFFPLAMGEVKVARTVIVDGMPTEVIDEVTVKEMAVAAEVIRKNMELVLKIRGVGKVGDSDGGEMLSEKKLTAIIHNVTNNIIINGAALPDADRSKVLELRSGDAIIDALSGD